jgi:hypothetical protein
VREIEARGGRAVALPGDLGRTADVTALANAAEEHSGGVSVLVNSASNYSRVPFDKLTEDVWDASLDTNLKAPFLLSWRLGRKMRDRGAGRIINLADWAGERPYSDYLPYCVSKAGVQIGTIRALFGGKVHLTPEPGRSPDFRLPIGESRAPPGWCRTRSGPRRRSCCASGKGRTSPPRRLEVAVVTHSVVLVPISSGSEGRAPRAVRSPPRSCGFRPRRVGSPPQARSATRR